MYPVFCSLPKEEPTHPSGFAHPRRSNPPVPPRRPSWDQRGWWLILWMEETLHHLGWNPKKNNGINHLSTGDSFSIHCKDSLVGLWLSSSILINPQYIGQYNPLSSSNRFLWRNLKGSWGVSHTISWDFNGGFIRSLTGRDVVGISWEWHGGLIMP